MIDMQEAQQKGLNIIDSTKQNNPLKSILERHFPDTLSEGEVNLNALAMLLGLDPHSNTQGYELTFTGKGLANTLYTTPTDFELSEEVERSKERESTQNSIIIGDNLDVLKILKSAYYEKIKMIYIDPPYNTKSENFIYPDDFRKDYRKILREVELLTIDEEGNEIESKALQTFRNITGSRSHSGWLSFMLPRLKLARDLLKEDGVIFISINDNEQANLKILCDEIFGEENFLYTLSVVDKLNGNDNSSGMMETHEYCLIYAKNMGIFEMGVLGIDDEEAQWEKDDLGYWKLGRELKATGENAPKHKRPNLFFPIYINEKDLTFSLQKTPHHLFELFPTTNGEEKTWYWSKQKFLCEKDEVIIKKTKEGYSLYKKQRPALGDLPSVRGKTTFYSPKYSTSNSNKNIKNLFGAKVFPYSKSKDLILDLVCLGNTTHNDIILDFFAGSGTTAQAVMELNAEDGGNRRFILVQLPEEIKEDKNKTAYDFVKNELGKNEPKISDITIERVNRAGEKLKSEGLVASSVDIGYRVYSLGEKARLSDEGSIIPHSANITPADIARNLALFAGKPLHIPLEEIVVDKLFMCEDILCVVGIDKEVEEKILEDKNRAIFIDGYGTYTLESFLNLNIPNDERVNIVY